MNICVEGGYVHILKHIKLSFFGFGFCLCPNHLQLWFEYKETPTTLLDYSLLKAACTHNIVHDSFKPNAAAASCLLFLYSLFLFSRCFLSGFVTDWFRGISFLLA